MFLHSPYRLFICGDTLISGESKNTNIFVLSTLMVESVLKGHDVLPVGVRGGDDVIWD